MTDVSTPTVVSLFPKAQRRPKGFVLEQAGDGPWWLTEHQQKMRLVHKARHQAKGNGWGYCLYTGKTPCPTIPKEGVHSASPILVAQDGRWRHLTPGELKAASSYPEAFRFEGDWADIYARIGNSVPPLFMKAIASHLRDYWLEPGMIPTVISLFAGCGGSSLGYQMAGYRELLAVEWDDNAVATFRLNFPDVPVYHGDIAKLSVKECLRLAGIAPGELDVLDGSPPCQGFSMAGRRRMTDDRNQLFREYCRLLDGLQPRVFIMENVAGMVRGKMKLIAREIFRELEACGYRVKAQLMNAMWFGVPQSRERMIFIGVREDVRKEPTFPKAQGRPVTVREAIGEMEPEGVRPISKRAASIWEKLPIGSTGTVVSGPNKDFSLCRLSPARLCPTLRKAQSTGNGVMHWAEPRFLGTNEMARLSSFPVEFRWVGDAQDATACIGNSVPPLFMQVLAAHIREHLLAERC